MICNWCQTLEAQYELAIYYLKEIETYEKGVTMSDPHKVLGRGDCYTLVRICHRCLPVTKIVETTETKHYIEVKRKEIK